MLVLRVQQTGDASVSLFCVTVDIGADLFTRSSASARFRNPEPYIEILSADLDSGSMYHRLGCVGKLAVRYVACDVWGSSTCRGSAV
jgi:hypothetical protein